MSHFLNLMRREAVRATAGMGKARYAIVDSYEPEKYAVKVRFQPSDVLSGWMPVLTPLTGNQWGLYCPPSPGDQVVVEAIEGRRELGAVIGRYFGAVNRPLAVNSGEFWLVHQSGSFLKLTNDGKISLNSAVEIDIGNTANSLHQIVTDALVTLFNSHVHTNGNGGANTGAPTTTMGAAHLTSVLKAN